MSRKHNHAQTAVISFIDTLGKIANSADRMMVREAGAIAPLISLMMHGTGDVPGRAAAVLRDLAQHTANRTAILEADGISQLVRMLSVTSQAIVTEAADALRSLSDQNLSICAAIRKHDGLKSLVALLKGTTDGAILKIVAGALTNMSQADPSSRGEIASSGAVQALVATLKGGFDTTGDRMRYGEGTQGWAKSKVCAATMRILHELREEPGCREVLTTQGGMIPTLVALLLQAGLESPTAEYAASLLVGVLHSDASGGALKSTLQAFTEAHADGASDVSSQGWSVKFTELRQLLQGAAESGLVAAEEGDSSSALRDAINVCKAVEISSERVARAQDHFEQIQAKKKREKLAMASEERRKAREEDDKARRVAEADAKKESRKNKGAEDDTTERRSRRSQKESVPSHFVKKGQAPPKSKAPITPIMSVEEEQVRAEAATIAAMKHMQPLIRERMIKKLIDTGQLIPGSGTLLAEYAATLGLAPSSAPAVVIASPAAGAMSLLDRLRGPAPNGAPASAIAAKPSTKSQLDDMLLEAATEAAIIQKKRDTQKVVAARNNMAERAVQRRIGIAVHRPPHHRLPVVDDYGEDDEEDYDDDSEDDELERKRMGASESLGGGYDPPTTAQAARGADGGGGFLGGLFGAKPAEKKRGKARRSRSPSTKRKGKAFAQAADTPKRDWDSSARVAPSSDTLRKHMPHGWATPSYMLPLFSRLPGVDQQAEEWTISRGPDEFDSNTWRNRWENRYSEEGGEYESKIRTSSVPASGRVPPPSLRGAPPSASRQPPQPLRSETQSTLNSSLYASDASHAHADSLWSVVRERIGEIRADQELNA